MLYLWRMQRQDWSHPRVAAQVRECWNVPSLQNQSPGMSQKWLEGFIEPPCLLGKPMVFCFPLSQSIDFTINAGAAQELGHPLSRQGGCSEDPFRGQSQIIFFACRWHARCVVWWCWWVNPQNPMVDNNHVYRLNGNCGVYTILNESCSNTHTHTHTVCQNGATCKMGSCSQRNVWVLLRVHFWDVNSSLRPWFVLTIVIAAGSNARPLWFSPCWWSHYNGWVIYSVRLLVASNIVYILAWWCQLTWIHRTHLNQF